MKFMIPSIINVLKSPLILQTYLSVHLSTCRIFSSLRSLIDNLITSRLRLNSRNMPTQKGVTKTKRGLWQGDSLSPYLFLLVAEGPARMMSKVVLNELLKGVGPTMESKVAILQFANDTLFFCEAKSRQIRNLLFV